MHVLSVLTALFSGSAFAQDPCGGIPNCSAAGLPLAAYIYPIAHVLLEAASGLAIVGVAVGGAYYLMNLGNESNATKGKTAVTGALIGMIIAITSQSIVSFFVARATYIQVASPHLSIMSVIVGSIVNIMNIAFVLSMLFFGFKLVLGRGQSSELDSAKKGLAWSIAGAILINLCYALVNAVTMLF